MLYRDVHDEIVLANAIISCPKPSRRISGPVQGYEPCGRDTMVRTRPLHRLLVGHRKRHDKDALNKPDIAEHDQQGTNRLGICVWLYR